MSQSPWVVGDLEKVIRLVEAVVGKGTLEDWRSFSVPDYYTAYKLLRPVISPKVQKFSSEKLGEVCGFATRFGYHHDLWGSGQPPRFINWTGYHDLSFTEVESILYQNDFIEVMRSIAVATIIALAIDYVQQDNMRACWSDPAAGGWKLHSRRT